MRVSDALAVENWSFLAGCDVAAWKEVVVSDNDSVCVYGVRTNNRVLLRDGSAATMHWQHLVYCNIDVDHPVGAAWENPKAPHSHPGQRPPQPTR